MERLVLVLLVLTGLSQEQNQPRCLLSRLDLMPCNSNDKSVLKAGQNEYSIHHTRLQPGSSGATECAIQSRPSQKVRPISTVDTENVRIIYSPGFINKKNYRNQLLVRYNIECNEDQLAYFNIVSLDTESENCNDTGNLRCQDYVRIDRGVGGSTEFCGNTPPKDSLSQLEAKNFEVVFRSSERGRFRGFEMYVVCIRQADIDLPGCLRPEDFNSSVCAGGESQQDNSRKRRDAYVDGLNYNDLFSGYPSKLRIRQDVANFHNQWLRQKRQAGADARFVERIVLFNESVNYTDNTIRITDSDNVEMGSYRGVLVLQTFDAEGMTTNYVVSVDSEEYPPFFGPGPLVIFGRFAYLQLFLIDPRGLIPTHEEEQELSSLNRVLLDAVPESDDEELEGPEPPIEDFAFLDFDSKRKRRATKEDSVGAHRRRFQRQDEEPVFSESEVFRALRNLEACNPPLRTTALSNLEHFESKEELREMLKELRRFNMTCSLRQKVVNCTVADGFAPALDISTYCTVNDGERKECEPFYGPPFELDSTDEIRNVTVEAINCNGQTARVVAFQEGDI